MLLYVRNAQLQLATTVPVHLITALISGRASLMSQIGILKHRRIPFPLIESCLVRISIEQVQWLTEIH